MARTRARYWWSVAAFFLVTALAGCGGDATLEVVEALTPTPVEESAQAQPTPTIDPAR
jgi:hypothetical protein